MEVKTAFYAIPVFHTRPTRWVSSHRKVMEVTLYCRLRKNSNCGNKAQCELVRPNTNLFNPHGFGREGGLYHIGRLRRNSARQRRAVALSSVTGGY